MDILILNWKDLKNPDVGGAEVILYELSKRFVRDGHTVTWLCRRYEGCTSEDTIDGIKIIRRGNRFSVYWEAYKYYRSLTKKPDKVIDCINTICWQTPLYVPKEKRIAYVNQLAREVLFYELPPIISHLAYFAEPIEYRTYRNTRFICYSESVKKDIASFGISGKNISTFPIGIDQHRYKPGKKSVDPLFVFVARLTAMKRPDLCVEAMRIVVKKFPKAKLAIVGYGPMEKALDKLIEHRRLSMNVFLVNKNHLYFDKHPNDQKVKLMQQAWALLLPSVKEGWGLVVTEAAASGTPSIGTDVTGLRNSIVHDETGIIIPSVSDAQQLAQAMLQIIGDKTLRQLLSDKAQKSSRRYSWDASYRSFFKIIGMHNRNVR